jgi:hypothetical protein
MERSGRFQPACFEILRLGLTIPCTCILGGFCYSLLYLKTLENHFIKTLQNYYITLNLKTFKNYYIIKLLYKLVSKKHIKKNMAKNQKKQFCFLRFFLTPPAVLNTPGRDDDVLNLAPYELVYSY